MSGLQIAGIRAGICSAPPMIAIRRHLDVAAKSTSAILESLAAANDKDALVRLLEAVSRELGFRHFALIDHDEIRTAPASHINLQNYPAAIFERLISQRMLGRDPIVRGCMFSEGAFLWSTLPRIIQLDRRDHLALAIGAQEGLNEGVTVPCSKGGLCVGSCTFAGVSRRYKAEQALGIAQIFGVFAFQAARRLTGEAPHPGAAPRLHPRPRDCVVLAGQGLSNKAIARRLSLTPRTVDGYITASKASLDAHSRTELVIKAILACEIHLSELKHGQPE